MDHRKVYLGELKTLMSKKGGNMFTGYIQRSGILRSLPCPKRTKPSSNT